ncbi:MAG: hypothetical protein GY796_26745 [Chloroflexi bacterium]|nr:hypothetical protein [Chloroflexota bacterium]
MLEKPLLTRIRKKKAQLEGLRPLPTAALKRLHEQLNIEWIYNANVIDRII